MIISASKGWTYKIFETTTQLMFFLVFFQVVLKNTPEDVQGSSKIDRKHNSMGKTNGQTIFKKNRYKNQDSGPRLIGSWACWKKQTCDLHSLQMIPSTMDVKKSLPQMLNVWYNLPTCTMKN